MLIVSNFHDYYDTAMTYGIDKTVVFSRNNSLGEKLKSRDFDLDWPEDHDTRKGRVRVTELLIGFCGKIYPAVRFDRLYQHKTQTTVVYNAEQFFLEAVDHDLHVDWKARLSGWSRLKFWGGGIHAGYAKEFFEKSYRELEDIFYKSHTPIFTIAYEGRDLWLRISPQLKPLQFAKVKDPASAFQDIYMYLSGVLGQPKDIPSKQTDKEKAASHGHDGEYSFKKPPGGKRWR
jgi:hypothetical protein